MSEIKKIRADYKLLGNPLEGATNAINLSLVKIGDAIVSQAKELSPVDFAELVNGIMFKTFKGEQGGFNERRGGERQ